MNISPLVSIFILNWNGKNIAGKCLESIRGILYDHYTVTLVDNGSIDDSVSYFKGLYPELDIIAIPENVGFTGGSNLAIKHLLKYQPKYICFVSNDVTVSPEFLNKLVEVAEKDPKIGIINPKIYYSNPSNRIWFAGGYFSVLQGKGVHNSFRKIDTSYTESTKLKKRGKEISTITGCVYLARAKLLEAVGGFDERFFNYAEDTDLALRIRKRGFKAFYAEDSIVWHDESFDIRNNAGKPYQNYYMARNILLLMDIHGTVLQRCFFLSFFLIKNIFLRTVYYAIRGEFKRIAATFKGVSDHLLKKYGKQKVIFS